MARGSRGSLGTAGARAEREDASFDRVKEALARAGAPLGIREARARFDDALRLAARVRRLEERLGRRGVAELSPYLESLLRMAQASRVVEASTLRQAASF